MYNRHISTTKPTIIFLSTYPPRECGIATFTQDLLSSSQEILGTTVDCKVAALNLSPLDTYTYPPEVIRELDQHNKADYLSLAKDINANMHVTGVMIQHEYGIFGGENGEMLIHFMKKCKKPMLVTLHTTIPTPSPEMLTVTQKIVRLASTIVVLTQNSKAIIEHLYPDSKNKIFVIPHGIHPSEFSDSQTYKEKLELENRLVLTTFGLLSRGKGIEYAIRALPKVIKKYPQVLYLILGETHPVVRRQEGEEYRLELAALISKLHLEKHVQFYDQYFTLPDLLEFLKATDVYIATSINPNQAVSGTLSYALGAGLAVISTEFSQAKEIVTEETGRLVPIMDTPALTSAIIELLSDEKRLKQMHQKAYEQTRPMVWDTVATTYVSLLKRIVIPEISLKHLIHMTDEFGLFQFASLSTPDKAFGYTIDDNARALIVCSWLSKSSPTEELERLTSLYLSFISACQQPDGSFANYIDYAAKQPTVQNINEDLEDAQTRALWALCEIMANDTLTAATRLKAKTMVVLYLKQEQPLTHLRSKAFAIKSLALIQNILPDKQLKLRQLITEYADALLLALTQQSIKSWRWFESDLNYNNALLSEGLLIAGEVLKNEEYTTSGLESLQFLISKTFSDTYRPIGHAHWYKNNEKRSEYDQQPEDPASMILALARAYKSTHNKEYKNLAMKCFSWFLGNNHLRLPLYDEKTGGCYDGIHPDRINQNQGAESLVSYLMANITVYENFTD